MRILKLDQIWKKYKYAVIIVLAGVLLMLLPRFGSDSGVQEKESLYDAELYSLEETESKMEALLGHIDGVGRLRVMLTLSSGPQLQLAADTDQTGGSGDTRSRRETVTVNRGSGYQEVVITRQLCPVYQGAVVVCQGAGNAAVRLAVVEAVSALTGLSSDKISVVKWKQS
ncbi:MAG: stage III sporulation protein AG [Oscillospiraceae bacterium]|nr:stage III sporulation protein AG [Oscillospiraceae bacterium]